MLSKEDIYKELGNNFYIYPVIEANIRNNSIDLTASKFAFSQDGNNIYQDGKIIMPSHKTSSILTNEAIYLSNKLGGTCHSRVGLTTKGLCHIGTNLDAGYYGQLLINLHNVTDEDIIISFNERIVTVILYYLSTPVALGAGLAANDWSPGHRDKLPEAIREKYNAWIDGTYNKTDDLDSSNTNIIESHHWARRNQDLLREKMSDSTEYKNIKEVMKEREDRFLTKRQKLKNWLCKIKWKKYLGVLAFCGVLYFIFSRLGLKPLDNAFIGGVLPVFLVALLGDRRE